MATNDHNHRIGTQLVHLGEGAVVLAALYSLVATIANHAAHVFGFGSDDKYPVATPLIETKGIQLCSVKLNDWGEIVDCVGNDLCCQAIACGLGIGLVALTLLYVCKTEWVHEKIQIEECWEEVKWYKPWQWVKALVCTIVEIVKAVLYVICEIKNWVLAGALVLCLLLAVAAGVIAGGFGGDDRELHPIGPPEDVIIEDGCIPATRTFESFADAR